jgi:hypothetical protein
MDVVQICNLALSRVSGQPIADIVSDHTKSASLCRTFYDPARDATIEEGLWSFARTRQSLAASADPNQTTYSYVYQLPTDPWCLRPLRILSSIYYDSIYPYEREGRKIYSNEPFAVLVYQARIEDPTLFSAGFVDALAWRLAMELIGPLDGESASDPFGMYQAALLRAIGADAQGSSSPDLPPDRIIDARFRGRRY